MIQEDNIQGPSDSIEALKMYILEKGIIVTQIVTLIFFYF